MRKTKTNLWGKLLAAFFAFALALCIAYGGISSAVYAEEEHVHDYTQMYQGYKNHWYGCECGTVKDMEPHNFVDDKCTVCEADKADPAHVHTFNDSKWENDNLNHWRQATCHGIVKDMAPHSADTDGRCICGYVDVTKIPAEIPDNISVAGGYKESMYAEWSSKSVNNVAAYYQKNGEESWTQVDGQLIRMVDKNTARVDVVGLKAGVYNLKISLDGKDSTVKDVNVTSYDRSGYAHFKYSQGVGAYKDDGTIKDNALVVYLTEENKNDVLDYCYVDGQKVDISQYMRGADGTQYTGIGEMLNNRRYAGNDRMDVGIARLSREFGAVVIRVLGKVEADYDGALSTITGLTDYNSTGNGGSVGDNGQMARIVNAKNLTVEGIGLDACIFGWGIHFINSDTLHKYDGAGRGFEVRNITFRNYPEDAVGMEGVQSKGINADGSSQSQSSKNTDTLYAPVERCWVHNNTFLSGYSKNPAESDKKEGDGSCDFKRGQYFTCSYNYFEDCHKTNLVGANGQTLQYNLTYHHNYWDGCKARQPLARNANIHYYNNFIQYTTDTVISARADCYLFAEANYFEGCKNSTEYNKEGSSTIKLYNNTFYACYEFKGGVATPVETRDEYVENTCQYRAGNIDYSHFDTNPEQFYYDAANKKSDCLITDATTARRDCILYAGVQKRSYENIKTNLNQNTPSKAISVPKAGLEVALSKDIKDGEKDGILFSNISGFSDGLKGKGQMITFTLADRAEITVTAVGSNADSKGELLKSDGTLIAGKFESFTGLLEPGTYVISSGQISKDGKNTKEVIITSLSFKSGVTDEEKVQNVINYIGAIGTVELTSACKDKIDVAQTAYNALSTELKAQVTNADVLTAAVAEYNTLAAQPVINLIEAIGTVGENSGAAISAARTAYDKLTADQQAKVTNYSTLTAAENAYADFAVSGLNNQIDELAATSTATTRDEINQLLEKYEAAKAAYEKLSSDKQGQITNYSKVTDGIAALNAKKAEIDKAEEEEAKLAAFRDALEAIDANKLDDCTLGNLSPVVEKYTALGELTDRLTAEEKSKYADIKTKYDNLLASQPKDEILVSATYNVEKDKINLSGTLITVTSANNFVNKTVPSELTLTADGLTFKNALVSCDNKKGITITAGNKAVSVVVYFTVTNKDYNTGKNSTVAVSGGQSVTTEANNAVKTVYKLEISIAANASCDITVSAEAFVFYGATAVAAE